MAHRHTLQAAGACAALCAALAFVPLASGNPSAGADGGAALTVTDKLFHLGNSNKPDWKSFTTEKPVHERRLELRFDAGEPASYRALELRAGEAGSTWKVLLNGRELGTLPKGNEARKAYFRLPRGLLKKEGNVLVVELTDKNPGDDIYVGRVRLRRESYEELLRLARVEVEVRDAASGVLLPSRLTVVRVLPGKKAGEAEREELAEVEIGKDDRLAVRRGIVYTLEGRAAFGLPAGHYRIYATRGFEYGLAREEVRLRMDERRTLRLTLEREVDTTGYLAADTHVHTLTYSKHGDASVEERVVTIAGEGVEIAVATDHNHHTDYTPVARKVGGLDRFLPVIGNEFTTAIGHFNAFPIEKGAKPANHKHKEWVRLLKALRATPGVRVVIVNHPRRPNFKDSAFGKIGLNPVTGEVHNGPQDLGIDAVEIVNGKGPYRDHELTIEDWFGLLNRGYRLAAVAASDSHTVAGIVGQARTYVRSSTDDPRRARIDEIADSFRRGRLIVSLGLLAEVKAGGKAEAGDMLEPAGDEIEVEISVRGPRWVRAGRVTAYLNGRPVKEERIAGAADAVEKYHGVWKIPAPPHDAHLVVIARGPAIKGLFWPQPHRDNGVLAVTNPVWIDADGDGRFTPAYEYARALIERAGTDAKRLAGELEGYDAAVALQAASILRTRIEDALTEAYAKLVLRAHEKLGSAVGAPERPEIARLLESYLKIAPALGTAACERAAARRLIPEDGGGAGTEEKTAGAGKQDGSQKGGASAGAAGRRAGSPEADAQPKAVEPARRKL